MNRNIFRRINNAGRHQITFTMIAAASSTAIRTEDPSTPVRRRLGFESFLVRGRATVTGLLAAGLCVTGVGGCSEIFTNSRQSRQIGLESMKAGDDAAALGAFRDAVRQNPRDYESYSYLGRLYAKDGQYGAAVMNFKTSLDLQERTGIGRSDTPTKVSTLNALADTLVKSDTRNVEIDKLSAKSADSRTGDESYVLAQVFAQRGDADSAIDAYRRASLQAPDKFYIAKAQGLYLERLGQKGTAEQALRRAYRLDDKDDEVSAALRRLGIIPGPALKEEGELVKPFLPRGPLPELFPGREKIDAPDRPNPSPEPPPGSADGASADPSASPAD